MTDTNGKQARLTRMQAYELINWLKERRETVMNTPDFDLAHDASVALKFPVTVNQVQATRSDLGMHKRSTWRKDPQADANREAIGALAALVSSLIEIARRPGVVSQTALDNMSSIAESIVERYS